MEESRVEDCCRTCLKESSDMRPMSSKWNNQLLFWEMLMDITGDTNDLLHNVPENICIQCQKRLSISYSFKKMCLKSKDMLSRCLSEDEHNVIEDRNIARASTAFDHDCSEPIPDVDLACQLAITSDATHKTKLKPIIFAEHDAVHNQTRKVPYDTNESSEIVETYLDEGDDEYQEPKASSGLEPETSIVEELAEEITVADYAPTYLHVEDEILEVDPSDIETTSQQFSIMRQCLTCRLTFDDHRSYQMHHRQVHRTRTVCTECGKLISKHAMDKHMQSHTKTKEHLCTECGKSFTLGENLKKHLRIHAGDKRYTCQHCGEQFIHWNSKRSHIRTVHTGEKKYECNICGKRFAQSSNMFRHVRQHTGELPHECSFCGKKFMTTPELRNHLVVHTKEKNEHCTVCLKSFGTRKALHTHKKIHTGERNYLCPVCSRTFTQAHVLRTHMKGHPDCPIPPAGTLLSQKALQRPPRILLIS